MWFVVFLAVHEVICLAGYMWLRIYRAVQPAQGELSRGGRSFGSLVLICSALGRRIYTGIIKCNENRGTTFLLNERKNRM